MSWVTTEAVRTGSPVIELGDSLRVFLRDVLELRSTGGGARGSGSRVTEQMKRLFGSLLTAFAADFEPPPTPRPSHPASCASAPPPFLVRRIAGLRGPPLPAVGERRTEAGTVGRRVRGAAHARRALSIRRLVDGFAPLVPAPVVLWMTRCGRRPTLRLRPHRPRGVTP